MRMIIIRTYTRCSEGGSVKALRIACISMVFWAVCDATAQDEATAAAREAMVVAANELYQSFGQGGFVGRSFGVDRAALGLHPLDDAQRQNWQFWPTTRVGLPLEYMSAAERGATHDLLAAALSAQGYLKAVHIMQLEQILDALDEAGFPRSVDHYVVAIFGEPSLQDPWAWRFEGHHVSLSVAVTPEGVAVTPSFFGSNPAQVVSGPLAGFRVHGQVEDLARQLVTSLSGRQQSAAIVADAPLGEIVTGNIGKPQSEWETWRTTLEPVGVAVGDLNEMQQHWVALIVDEVVGNYADSIQAPYRDALDLDELRFAWMGSTERGEPHYFRLHGPEFLFEYDNVQNGGNHVHSVWRNVANDFGEDLLARHYAEAH